MLLNPVLGDADCCCKSVEEVDDNNPILGDGESDEDVDDVDEEDEEVDNNDDGTLLLNPMLGENERPPPIDPLKEGCWLPGNNNPDDGCC